MHYDIYACGRVFVAPLIFMPAAGGGSVKGAVGSWASPRNRDGLPVKQKLPQSQFHRLGAFWNEIACSEVLSPQAKVSDQRKDATMKIAQIAPLMESVPPRQYGGTERVVSYLTEELVRLGHDVTLFASGDSATSARLLSFCDTALRLDPRVKDPAPHHIVMLDAVREMAHEFDVLHFHVDVLHYPLIRDFVDRTVTTLHGRLDMPESRRLYSVFSGAPLVSISFDQRKPMPPVNWAGMVYHGLPRDLLPFNPAPKDGGYFAFLGRISPEKRPDRAIEIATRAGARLKIAAKIDRVDQDYWTQRIKPMVDGNPMVEFIGEINEKQKAQFLGEADGAAVSDRLAGAIRHGHDRVDGLRHAGDRLPSRIVARNRRRRQVRLPGRETSTRRSRPSQRVGDLDRRGVRACFEARFTVARFARDYVSIYRIPAGRPVEVVADADRGPDGFRQARVARGKLQVVVTTVTGPRRSRTSTTTCSRERRSAMSALAPATVRPVRTMVSRNAGRTGSEKMIRRSTGSNVSPRQDWMSDSGAAAAQACGAQATG